MQGRTPRRGGGEGRGPSGRPRAAPVGVDSSAIAAIVARALADSRGYGDPDIAVAAVLSDTLPALGVDFALALGPDGQAIASAGAPREGLDATFETPDRLLSAGAAALAGAATALESDIGALPLKADGEIVGALVLQARSPVERPDFAAGVKLLADCLGMLATASPAPSPPARRSEMDRTGVPARLIRSLAAHDDGVALFGEDAGLVMANRAFVEAHGASFRELQGLTLEDILRRNHHGFGPLLLARDVSDEKGGAEMALAADGRWLRLSRRRSASGDELVLQSSADDMLSGVTEARRRVHAARSKAESRARLWDGLAVGAILLSRTGRILEANQEAARLLRATEDDLVGRRLGRLADAVSDRWSPVGRARAGDGRQLAAKARRLDDGQTLLALTVLPEPSRPAVEAAHARDPLAGAQALGELAHEMRTPLNAVIGFADVMLSRSFGPVNDRQAQYLQDIGGAGRHMLTMVDNMLDHVQLASGRYPFDPEWVDLGALAGEAIRLLEAMADENDVELLIVPIADLEAFVDRRGMLQVLINLLTNAIKFTPAGGLVTLSATALPDGLYLRVTDTGEGIPAADLARVKEPFTQARRIGGQMLKGAGLGLSIVHAIVDLHGGEVEIASELGEGTEITVRLPADCVRNPD